MMEANLSNKTINLHYELSPDSSKPERFSSSIPTNDKVKFLLKHLTPEAWNDFLTMLAPQTGKKCFLVFSNNRYLTIHTQNIALFYIKYESPVIMCFDKQEYFINSSLDQIQGLLPANQFFRINRQYLLNFDAVKEVEYFLARKLLVNLVIPTKEKLLVPRMKSSEFLSWLDR